MKHLLSELTHAELAGRLRRPAVILIPLGSQEAQGPHSPMGDHRLTEVLAARAAAAGDGLAAPTLPFGYADYFRAIPGGVQLRAETFMAVLEDMLGAFLDHGMERLLIFNGHTGNAPLIDQVTRRIRRDRGVIIPSLNIWRSIPDGLFAECFGPEAGRLRGHGGEPVSSVYAHLLPDLLRPDLATPPAPRGTALGLPVASVSAVRFQGLPLQMPLDCHEVDANGMLGGSAAGISAAAGQVICDHIVSHTAALMRHLVTCDPRRIDSGAGEGGQ